MKVSSPILASICVVASLFLFSCEKSNHKLNKGFEVELPEAEDDNNPNEPKLHMASFETRPGPVINTAHAEHRITPVFKINHDKKGKPFIGSIGYHKNYRNYYRDYDNDPGHFMPGLEAVYGFNLTNVAHHRTDTMSQNFLFKQPALIKTLYYPAMPTDSINDEPVLRDYYLVSTYDQDSNRDSVINWKDQRHFYYFDLNGNNQTAIVPMGYSVLNCRYDESNDFMYVYAQQDGNKNGKREANESIHIFWVDLNNPLRNGLFYSEDN